MDEQTTLSPTPNLSMVLPFFPGDGDDGRGGQVGVSGDLRWFEGCCLE